MRTTFDPYLFTQLGLDSGSLTMLGSVTHQFAEPGEYRGSIHRGEEVESVFYINVDKNSPVGQVNVDLSQHGKESTDVASCCSQGGHRYSVNPKGYALFHVSSGAGGYYVHARRANDDPKQRIFDSRKLEEGDIFSAVILRPGTYSVTNESTKARAEFSVPYPKVGKVAYRPPKPIQVNCARDSFDPKKFDLQPGQAILFQFKTQSRIKIELVKPDDGPRRPQQPNRVGWEKMALSRKQG